MRAIILLVTIAVSLSGCASAILKSGCGHINGTHVTIPYAGGSADGNAYGCYELYTGTGKGPDANTISNDLATITAEYIKDASKDNQITTSGPVIITATPVSK